MSWADTDYLRTLIEGVPILATATYITQVPKQPTGNPPLALPYALIHPSDGVDEQTRNTGPYSTEHPEFTLHFVGEDAEQCKAIAELVKAKVIVNGFGIIPTISGRRCQRAYWRSPIPIQTDPDVTPPICFYVVEVGWVSDLA